MLLRIREGALLPGLLIWVREAVLLPGYNAAALLRGCKAVRIREGVLLPGALLWVREVVLRGPEELFVREVLLPGRDAVVLLRVREGVLLPDYFGSVKQYYFRDAMPQHAFADAK